MPAASQAGLFILGGVAIGVWLYVLLLVPGMGGAAWRLGPAGARHGRRPARGACHARLDPHGHQRETDGLWATMLTFAGGALAVLALGPIDGQG